MFRYGFLCILILAAAVHAEDQEIVPVRAQRFLIRSSTSTIVLLSSTTTSTVVAKTCATTAAGIGICRRRRGIEEIPIIITSDEESGVSNLSPSEPIIVKTTVSAELSPVVTQEVEIASSVDTVEADIVGLPSCIEQRNPFLAIITLWYTSYTTATITSTSTSTSGSKVFTISGCIPGDLTYAFC